MEVTVRAATIKVWVTKIVYSEEGEQIDHLKRAKKRWCNENKVMTVLQQRCDKLYQTSHVQVKKKNAENNPSITAIGSYY